MLALLISEVSLKVIQWGFLWLGQVWTWSAAKKGAHQTQPQVSHSSLAGGRPECLIRKQQSHKEKCLMLKETILHFHHRICFWWQLICATWCQKIDILFGGVCDVTVMQCNIWGSGSWPAMTQAHVPGHSEPTCSKAALSWAEKAENEESTVAAHRCAPPWVDVVSAPDRCRLGTTLTSVSEQLAAEMSVWKAS